MILKLTTFVYEDLGGDVAGESVEQTVLIFAEKIEAITDQRMATNDDAPTAITMQSGDQFPVKQTIEQIEEVLKRWNVRRTYEMISLQ